MKRSFRWLSAALFAACSLLALGCDSTEPSDEFDPETTGVYVANQGSFTDANGSVIRYDPRDRSVVDLTGPLGSTVQSLFLQGNRLYVLANSGNRIEAVHLSGEPTVSFPLLSPRYMVQTSDSTAYVTSLFGSPGAFSGGKVFEIDLERHAVGDSIVVGDNPEGLAVVDSLAFVANNGFGAGTTVSVIDVRTNSLLETVDVGCDGPRSVIADDDPEVWVFCTGNTIYDGNGQVVDQTNGAVRILDPATWTVTERIDLDGQISTIGPGQDVVHAVGLQQIFAVVDANRLLRFDTRSNQQIAEIGPLEGDPIGAIGFDPIAEQLYLGRVPGFTESGLVTIHNLQGQQVHSFVAGVAPTFITVRTAD